jgi:hypothetical protein
MGLSSDLLPVCHFEERHRIVIAADAPAIHAAIAAFDMDSDPLFARLRAIRELPHRWLGARASAPSRPPFGLHDFTMLGRTPTETAYGLVGRFWKPDYGLVAIPDAQAFRSCDARGVARLVLAFETMPGPGTRTTLETSTRIACADRAVRRRMRIYWTIIRPASGLIRRRMLNRIQKIVESAPMGAGDPARPSQSLTAARGRSRAAASPPRFRRCPDRLPGGDGRSAG